MVHQHSKLKTLTKLNKSAFSFVLGEAHFNVCVKILLAGLSTRDPITRIVIGKDVAVDPEIQEITTTSPDLTTRLEDKIIMH